jgi:hypothetical protein
VVSAFHAPTLLDRVGLVAEREEGAVCCVLSAPISTPHPASSRGDGRRMAFKSPFSKFRLLAPASIGHLSSLLNFFHQRMQRTDDFHFGTSSVASRDTVAAERSSVMTCLELALTAQLICVSGQTIVCTDNGSIAQLLGAAACTITERSRPNDDHRRIQAQRD